MYMNIDKTGNNTAIIKIENRYPLRGNDTGLHAGNDSSVHLHVGGNKTPVGKHFAAFNDKTFHAVPPLRRIKSPL